MRRAGFTLPELMIAFTLLALLATFLVPKVLDAGSNSQKNHAVRQAVMEVSAAFNQYIGDEALATTTTMGALTSYINYNKVDTATTPDLPPSWTKSSSTQCGTSNLVCLRLANGAILEFFGTETFAGTAITNAVSFGIDPSGSNSGDNDAVYFALYYDGRIKDWGKIATGTVVGGSSYNPTTATVPSWFTWN